MAGRAAALRESTTRAWGSAWRYLLVGGFNSLLDLGLFTLFAVGVGLQPLVSNVLSTSITICVSYVLNRLWVFRSSRSVAGTALRFVALTLVTGLVVQSAVISAVIAVGRSVVPDVPQALLAPSAKVCAMGVGMVVNYVGYRWLFGERAPLVAD